MVQIKFKSENYDLRQILKFGDLWHILKTSWVKIFEKFTKINDLAGDGM